jgi:hypothetical protein
MWGGRFTVSGIDIAVLAARAALTAAYPLLVQEYTDAKTIVRVVMSGGESHYYNRLPTGEDVDLTRDQFDRFKTVGSPEERTREHLLSNDDTARRYQLLRQRLTRLWFGK